MVPSNVSLIQLPPYSPELNPVENLWHYLRAHHWSNRPGRNPVSEEIRCQFIILARKDALTSREEARERRIVTTVKPFAGTLRVTNPARKSRASSRKRVLHDGGQPPL